MAAALKLYDRACADYERVLGAEHPQTLGCRGELARAYYTAGLLDATTLLRDTLSRSEQALPLGHPLTQALHETMTSIAGGQQA